MKKLIIFIAIYLLFLFSSASQAKEKNTIYIYKDTGAGEHSQLQTISTLKEILPHNYKVIQINARGVILNKWPIDAVLFIMPGGADLPYVKKLSGKGNQNIKNYVKNGGAYLGICAGSYYGAGYVEFDKGGKLEVIGKRELAFFPGKAVGPALAKYSYIDNSGARAAKIKLKLENIKEATVYYNGGGYFNGADNYKNVAVLGYYQNHLPAIVYIPFGKGRVVLSGVHFEYDPSLMDSHDPYLNKILPDLKNSNITRKILSKKIFEKLGMISY